MQTQTPVEIRRLIRTKELELSQLRTNLDYEVKRCPHQWTTVQDNLVTPAYTIPGDPPVQWGIDWRGPCYVPEKVTKRWRRTCKLCEQVEFTTNSTQKVETTHQPCF